MWRTSSILCFNEPNRLLLIGWNSDRLVLQAVNCAGGRLGKGSQASRGALQLRDQRQFDWKILMMPTVCRWAVNIAGWQPKQEEWKFLLTLLPVEVQAEVQPYRVPADQRRALVSRLLQRKCAGDVCNVAVSEIVVKRTKGGKPFCANICNRAAAPNFNYNVSHEGDYVVLAAEPLCTCGIDVAAPPQARATKIQSAEDLFLAFEKQFTAKEWKSVKAAGDEAGQIQAFQKHWSLKEVQGFCVRADVQQLLCSIVICTSAPTQSSHGLLLDNIWTNVEPSQS